jgi:hypothetical protein
MLRSKFVSIIWCWGERSMYHEGHNNMSHTAWWQSTFIWKIIYLYQKIKKLHPWYENISRKISYLTLRSKVTRRSWWCITHHLMAYLYTKYHKSISKNKKMKFLIRKCTQKSIIWTWDQRPHEGRDYISHTICW